MSDNKPRPFRGRLLLIPLLCVAVQSATPSAHIAAQDRRSEKWQEQYMGTDASGVHVLGYWRFSEGQETKDSSSHGHELTLSGATSVLAGQFGAAIESQPGWPVADTRHAAVAKPSRVLSPVGAFTVEMWIQPGNELTQRQQPVLFDKKYVAHADYQLRLTSADPAGKRRLQLSLGFGQDSELFFSNPIPMTNAWHHIAFTYDAAGTVRFFHNGRPWGTVHKSGRGPIFPGRHGLSIGDRVGSLYAGFPGRIDEVRICKGALEFRRLSIEFASNRHSLVRMEKPHPISVTVTNLSSETVSGLILELATSGLNKRQLTIPELNPGTTFTTDYDLDTSLRPATYQVRAVLRSGADQRTEPPPISNEEDTFEIVARPLKRMPVLMWGLASPTSVLEELPRLIDLGFTHSLGGNADVGSIWGAKKPIPPTSPERIEATNRMLDKALTNDFGIAFATSPGHWLKTRPDIQRVDRKGEPYSSRPDVNAAMPGLEKFCENVGASIAQTYFDFPAWQSVLINTEVRDSSQLSFSAFDADAYLSSSGAAIPDEVVIKNGVQWNKLKDFPKNRIISDDHPVLAFYKWFWTVGDGWNRLHSAVHRGIHSTGRDDVWTWFDPAIRAPSISGSGGDTDALGQWTYTNPDPIRIGYFTDELLTMANTGSRKQKVMKMTQLFWYRSQTAPKKSGKDYVASPFDDHDPDAAYITIAPTHLRESFWTKISRPVDGIMYHGWQALVPTGSTGGYRHTHPDTQAEFRRLHRDVLQPLGPMLLAIGDRPSDVAYLDSFASQMFARRGSYGYSNDETYITLLYAQLQPEVIFDETITRFGLSRFKVLVLSDCDVLTEKVAARIKEFQNHGGIVVGDPNLAPGIKADITIPRIRRTKNALADQETLLSNAALLKSKLDSRYTRYVDSTEPRVVTRCRQAGTSDYVFVVNDHREPGTYVGQHNLVMDHGLPSRTMISVRRDGGVVYDLVRHRAVNAIPRDGSLIWNVDLAPSDGNVFLVAPRPIDSVKIANESECIRGSTCDITIRVVDNNNELVDTALPLHVTISDPAGRQAEFSGYHSSSGGVLNLSLDIATNDRVGVWQIDVQELAAGNRVSSYIRIK